MKQNYIGLKGGRRVLNKKKRFKAIKDTLKRF